MKTQNYNSKLKIIYFCLNFALCTATLNFALLTFNFSTVNADGISLSVSPSLLQIHLNPPAESKTPLTLQNQGTEPINIQVLFKPFRPYGESGQIEYFNDQTPDSYKNIFSKISLTDNGIVTTHFELGPKQKKNLELHFTIPKNEKISDYYFSLIFLASPKPLAEAGSVPQTPSQPEEVGPAPEANTQDQNFSTINAGIAANVLLSIRSKNQPQAAIEEFSAPNFLQSGPVEFTVRIKNTGPHFITPKGIIFIKNIFGQTIARLDISPANILSSSTRSLTDEASTKLVNLGNNQTRSNSSFSSVQSSLPAGEAGKFSVQKIFWNENFLLGPYTATLNLALSEKGPIFNQSIVFLALPLQLIIVITLALAIAITIFLRVRYRLKTDR